MRGAVSGLDRVGMICGFSPSGKRKRRLENVFDICDSGGCAVNVQGKHKGWKLRLRVAVCRRGCHSYDLWFDKRASRPPGGVEHKKDGGIWDCPATLVACLAVDILRMFELL